MIFGNRDKGQPSAMGVNQNNEIIFDADVNNFEESVMRASINTPIIVDFWAPWCGPCKQIMPVLEKAVLAAEGQVLLAKVNIDENPELAQALRIQSVPTVYAFFQGQPVDAFMGAQPESKIKEFIGKLLAMANGAKPDAIDVPEGLKAAAQALASGDINTAQAIYMQILEQDEQCVEAYVGMVRVLIAADQIDDAQNLIDNVPDVIAKSSLFEQAQAAVNMAKTKPAGREQEFLEKIEADPNDHQARIDLAYALFTSGKKSEAADALLESIALDRAWNEEAARKELLTLFSAMGNADPVTVAARRKLSSILFS